MTTQPRKKRRPLRRLKKVFSKPLAGLAARALPAIYLFYMNLVYRTSRITHINLAEMQEARVRHGRVLSGLWHEVVFLVAYSFREFHGSTLASRGDLGDLIARMLELCQFEVFRGGSSRGRSRRKRVLVDLIRHMKTHHNVIYGITVDGSHGPAHVLKSGIVAIARSTGAPIYATHIACRPCLRAPTWDRTQIPLPFSKIVLLSEGPIFCPAEVGHDEFTEICQEVERLIADTARRAEAYAADGVLPPPQVDRGIDYGKRVLRRGIRLFRPDEIVRPVPLDQ